MYISGRNNIYGNPVNEKTFGIKKTEKAKKEEEISLPQKLDKENQEQRQDSLEISSEGKLAAGLVQEAQELAGDSTKEQENENVSKKQENLEQENLEQENLGVSGGKDESGVSSEQGGKVAVNEGKRARQIAAAKTQDQVRQVLALLKKDLSDCKAGLEKGWCDESEIAKVEALMNKAEARLSQVPQKADEENSQGGLDEFAMASLM